MTLNDYSDFVLERAKVFPTTELDGADMELLHCALGLAGEAGEFVDAVKKYLIYNQPIDMDNMDEEAGDLLFYIQMYCNLTQSSIEDLLENNTVKLNKRYPTGYSDEHAKLRLDKNT
jgi:NTP pyrophosphatase (non-canonical NTP hydrolase)